MPVKLFILGRPGSGKSTASYCITGLAWRKGWFVIRISDYKILWEMYQADADHKQFIPTQEYKGFDVLDLSVLDMTLKELERQAQIHPSFEAEKGLVIIEFARDDYEKALKQFSPNFLQDAYFLFIEADVETCIQRIYERATRPLTIDDSFVSDYVLRNYYHKDSREYIASQLEADHKISKLIEIIDNMGSRQDFSEQVQRFAAVMLEREI